MARFSYTTTKRGYSLTKSILPSLLLFGMVVVLFIVGTGSLSKGSTKRQKDSLIDALSRDIVYCYATTGHYPESLEAIRRDYGLYYNEELFYVDYQVRAQNIIPDVTIIELSPEEDSSAFSNVNDGLFGFYESILGLKDKMKSNFYEKINIKKQKN